MYLKRLMAAALLGSTVIMAAAWAQSTLMFTAVMPEPVVDTTPLALASADLDGDGNIDLVVVNSDADDVSVLKGHGDGTFETALNLDVGVLPVAVAIRDFNGDGKPDIITADSVDNTVTVLPNQGSMTFGQPIATDTGVSPAGIAVGDFNGDGKADVATADSFDDTVSILLGTGTGAFGLPTAIAVGAAPENITARELNSDGKVDLVVANTQGGTDGIGSISILKGHGDGTFEALPEIAADVIDGPVAVLAADFNNDGKIDIAVVNGDSDDVAILIGHGDLTFDAPLLPTTLVASSPLAGAIGDFDGDGKLDIATSSEFEDKAAVILGKGDGTFADYVPFDVGAAPAGIVGVDLNKDQKIDIATVGQDTQTVSVLLNETQLAACVGDCAGDGEVTVDELLIMVNIALGSAQVDTCLAGDKDGNGEVTIDEILLSVNNALNGCAQ